MLTVESRLSVLTVLLVAPAFTGCNLTSGLMHSRSTGTTPDSIHDLQAGEDLAVIVDATPGVVLVDFYADWCGPCRQQAKVLHEIQESSTGDPPRIIKVDIDRHQELAEEYSVKSLPTLVVLDDGKLRHRMTGFTDRDEIQSILEPAGGN